MFCIFCLAYKEANPTYVAGAPVKKVLDNRIIFMDRVKQDMFFLAEADR